MTYIQAADAIIKEYCGQPFDCPPVSYTDFYTGTGTQYLTLRTRPCLSVPAPQVWLDPFGYFGEANGAFAPNTQLTYGADFLLNIDQRDGVTSRSAILIKPDSAWPQIPKAYIPGRLTPEQMPSFGNIKVTATYGFNAIPYDLQHACNWCAAYIKRAGPQGGNLQSEGLGQYNYAIAQRALGAMLEIGEIRQVLSRWRDIAV